MSLAERNTLTQVEWKENGIVIPENITFEDWQELGKNLRRIEGAIQWAIGDWLNFGERKWGDKYSQAMLETGKTYSTLSKYASVSSRFQFFRRRKKLPWSHHEAITVLPEADWDSWLDRAESEDWSVGELRGRIRNKAPDEVIVSMTKTKAAALEAEAEQAATLRTENEQLKAERQQTAPVEPREEPSAPSFAKPQPQGRPRVERVFVQPDTVESFKQACHNLLDAAESYPDDWNAMTKGDFRKSLEAVNEMAKGFLA